jgi:hypothetical protein
MAYGKFQVFDNDSNKSELGLHWRKNVKKQTLTFQKGLASIIRAIKSHRPDDGGSKIFWNVGQYLLQYNRAKHPRRQPSSSY